MAQPLDVKEFAIRVERLCDFLLDKFEIKDGSNDLKAIQDIKEDAANLQFANEISLEGLFDYINKV